MNHLKSPHEHGASPTIIILASGSPQRKQLVSNLGVPFRIRVPDVDESLPPGRIHRAIEAVAIRKALAVARRTDGEYAERRAESPGEGTLAVVAADTVIVHRRTVIGKPRTRSEAARILTSLSGRTHKVITGIALMVRGGSGNPAPSAAAPSAAGTSGTGTSGTGSSLAADHAEEGWRATTHVAVTAVRFRRLANDDIDWYLRTGEWRDAAGAYRIQGAGACLIRWIRGSCSNVIGLPMSELYGMFQANGIRIP